ncbi:MAG: hypothetical protein K2Q18_12345 [Bdellovibrionales bacterium]|nr:hypothetical protein [Bdellovibrionales bacterium]
MFKDKHSSYVFVFIMITMILSSCVGTVKDKNSQSGNITDTGNASSASTFNGLTSANPISHNKVELSFFPAKGDQANLTYEIYINGSPIASKLSGKTLIINSKGLMSAIVSNLSINTTYSFNMKAIDSSANISSTLDPAKALTATTFSNETADFQGISTVVLGAGESGKTTAIVSWLQATTKGSSISPRATDPVAYEVRYISQLGGIGNLNNLKYSGPDRVIIQNPSSLSTSPTLSTQTSMSIGGLNPGTVYYFQVRAIHKNFAIYGADTTYKHEMNTKYLYIKTLDSSGIFDFATNQVALTNPVGEDGLTRLNVAWLPASGAFNHYRVCYKKIAGPSVDPSVVPLDDKLLDSNSFDINNCDIKTAEDNFHQLISLDSYAYYQVKVVACKSVLCDFGNRIMSDVLQKRVQTNVAPFGGILSFENPKLESAINNIKAFFNPPVLSAGYINEFRMYCYSSSSDTSPVRIDNRTFPTSGTGKSNCDGIEIPTVFPTTQSEFANFNELEIKLPAGGIDGVKQYCFSLVPTIESTYLTQSDLTNSILKCFIPQIKTPSVIQFPGRNELCNVMNKDLQITWPTPTGGIYSKFIIFYQEKLTGLEFFDYQSAINEYISGMPGVYKWVDNIDKALISQNITGLVPGSKYNIGVLPYLNYNTTKMWGQFNYSVGECSLPLPKAKFKEWAQIFAVGPKEDGLTPPDQLGNRTFILETMNDDDQPVEIKTTPADIKVPDLTNSLSANRTGGVNFDGIYGRYNSVATNPLHQYSNSGIVKIKWNDVTLYNDTENFKNYHDTLATRNNRKYGYRIYRSEDNKQTWKDLTARGTSNPNQSSLNAGLIQTTTYSWRKRNNDAPIVTTVASFTDYSVKFAGSSGETDRARVYYYKIVPVFNSQEIVYDDSTNPNHNIVKVILPPRNMALVNRMMANKTICNEMNLPIKRQAAQYYSCDYDGLGSKALAPPYSNGNTVYDAGGDSLVDRFELGTPFTRGDPSTSNSSSAYTGTKLNFSGFAANGSKYSGCFNGSNSLYEPNNGTPLATGSYSYGKLMPGDCIGKDMPIRATNRATACADPSKTYYLPFMYPGATGDDFVTLCGSNEYNGLNFSNMANTGSLLYTDEDYAETQGEFASVYFMRNAYGNGFNSDAKGVYNYPVSSSSYIKYDHAQRLGMVFVNIPYLDNSNILHPRWIPTNRLFGNISIGSSNGAFNSAASISLYDKTISQITSSSLYDGTSVKAPTGVLVDSSRYNKSSTVLGRIISSNSSKLPPIQNFSQTQFHKLCSTYKVQVGVETSTGFRSLIGSTDLSKRLMRKKESTVSSAWPETWDNTKVSNIEKGTDASNLGCNGRLKTRPAGTANLTINSTLDNYLPWASASLPFSLSGSTGTNSSEACTSKFGVQDLAGNVKELNSDQFFCTFLSTSPTAHKPTIYIGDPTTKDPDHSAKYNSAYHYDNTTAQPWVSGFPDSGSCSVVEIGSSHTGNYSSSGAFSSIYLPDSKVINPAVVGQAKNFDQDSVATARNGDGTFLDFGTSNIGPVLNGPDSFNLPGLFFNVPLGLPVGCSGGCSSGGGADNKLIATDFHAAISGSSYDIVETPIQNFPVNNSSFGNFGVEDISEYGSITTNDANLSFPFQYVSGVKDLGSPALNTLDLTTINSPTSSPGQLYQYYFKVDRNSAMRFSTGGGATSDPGRYTFFMDGRNDFDDRTLSDTGARCAILIEE